MLVIIISLCVLRMLKTTSGIFRKVFGIHLVMRSVGTEGMKTGSYRRKEKAEDSNMLT